MGVQGAKAVVGRGHGRARFSTERCGWPWTCGAAKTGPGPRTIGRARKNRVGNRATCGGEGLPFTAADPWPPCAARARFDPPARVR